eukprot:Skav224303  [mRNA]  locus=scaffold772:306005:309327:+ [translate_table: standard]
MDPYFENPPYDSFVSHDPWTFFWSQAQYGLKRVSMCGSSMGAYGALELTSRRPRNFFSAVALIAAHYDLDPVEPLVTRLLTEKQEVPLWFIHAENDNVCPFADMEDLVQRLRLGIHG